MERRTNSPTRTGAARSHSSTSYPSGQSGAGSSATRDSGEQQQQHSSRRTRAGGASLTHVTGEAEGPRSAQQRSTRSGGVNHPRGGGCAAPGTSSLFDTTVLTSSSSPSREAGRAMAQLLDSVASSSSYTPPPTREQRTRSSTQQQQQQKPAKKGEVVSARRLQKAEREEEGEISALLRDSPVWPPQPQQQSFSPRQAAHSHHSSPRRTTPPPPPPAAATHHPAQDDEDTPISVDAEDTSSMLGASSVYSRDEQRSAVHSFSSTQGDNNWASPSEVLQLHAMVQEVAAHYQREQMRLQAELAKAQTECTAYAAERSRVQQLQKAYTEGLAQCAQVKQQEARWTEEKALQQLQLEKMMMENQRLQLFIAKRQKLHRLKDGSAALLVSTESQERVLAAVHGVTAAAAAATASLRGQPSTLSPSPFAYTSGSMTATSMLPAAASPTPSATQHAAAGPATPSPTGRGGGATVHGSPYTFVSSESTPPSLKPTTRRAENATGAADHTQLPVASERIATSAARPSSANPAAVSPSNDDSASCLSLSPTLLQQPPAAQGSAAPHRGDECSPERGTSKRCGGEGQHEREGGETSTEASQQRQQEMDRRRSSSMLTPSPTASGAPSTAATSHHNRAAATVPGAAASALVHSQPFLSYIGVEEEEEEGREGHDNDDPSYARGVNDISSSTSRGSHLSAGAACVMGRLMNAEGRLQQQQQQHQVVEEEMSSSPLVTSGPLLNGPLNKTTAPRESTATAAAPGATSSTGTTTGKTNTTTTTPSLTDSTQESLQRRLRGAAATSSSSAPSATSSTWSLHYLYQLPCTPAEALEEELRMMKEIYRLTEENAALTARWEHAVALKDMDADQREQQLLRLAQNHEQARRSAAEAELMVQQLQSEVSAMAVQLDDVRAALDGVLAVSRQQQVQAQARLVEAEAQSRAALAATREETLMRLTALRRALHEVPHKRVLSESSSSSGNTEEKECDALRRVAEALRTELHTARAAQVALEDQRHALTTESTARITHVESALVRTADALERVTADRDSALRRVDELEAEVERLRETTAAREECMSAMKERLRLATGELATQQEQLAEASMWRTRAVSTEEDLATQRAFYEKEVKVYKTATCAMQESHRREMAKAVRRYEKLVLRFEALRLQLSIAPADSVGWTGSVPTDVPAKKKRVHKSATNTAENSPNAVTAEDGCEGGRRGGEEGGAFILPDPTVGSRTAQLACDAVATLRNSVEATERVARSLDRAAASPWRS